MTTTRKAHRLKLTATRVRINRQGYDSRGRYWGVGAPLYEVEHENLSAHVRAPDAKTAKVRALPEIERELERDIERERGYRVPGR